MCTRCARPRAFWRVTTHDPSTAPVNPATRQPCATIEPMVSGRSNSHGAGALSVAGRSVATWLGGRTVVCAASAPVVDALAFADSGPGICPAAMSPSRRIDATLTLPMPSTAAPAIPAAILPTKSRRDSISHLLPIYQWLLGTTARRPGATHISVTLPRRARRTRVRGARRDRPLLIADHGFFALNSLAPFFVKLVKLPSQHRPVS